MILVFVVEKNALTNDKRSGLIYLATSRLTTSKLSKALPTTGSLKTKAHLQSWSPRLTPSLHTLLIHQRCSWQIAKSERRTRLQPTLISLRGFGS